MVKFMMIRLTDIDKPMSKSMKVNGLKSYACY